MLTTPYVFNADEAAAMAQAGADLIVCHLGLTTGGSIGAETALKLADCPALVEAFARRPSRSGATIVLAHGGPVSSPEDAAFIIREHKELSRLLRCVINGAPADRNGPDGTDAEVQAIGRQRG